MLAQAGKIAVLSVAFLVSVVLGNVSLKHIPVSFSQVALFAAMSVSLADSLVSCIQQAQALRRSQADVLAHDWTAPALCSQGHPLSHDYALQHCCLCMQPVAELAQMFFSCKANTLQLSCECKMQLLRQQPCSTPILSAVP